MTEWIVSSSVLIAAMVILRRVLKGKLNPRLQYALWAIVLVRLLVPVSFFESGLSVQNVRDEVMETPRVQQVYTAVTTPIPVENYDRVYREVVREYEAQGVDVEEMDESEVETEVYSRMDTISVKEVLNILWIAGMAVMAGWLIGCNARFALRLRRSRQALDVAYSPVPVYITGAVETPCLFGMFRPAIYLTPESAEDEVVKRYVLTHEITHYQQFDHIWATLRALCLVLHWYNPLVWLAFRLSRQDGEMACDEGTLMILGEEHRGNYGRTLIALATRTRLRTSLVTATTMADGKKAIKERIVILMKNPKTPFVTMIALILVCTLVVGCTFTGSIQGEIKENGEGTEPTETTEPAETTIPSQNTPLQSETAPTEPYAEYYELLSAGGPGNWLHEAMNYVFSDPRDLDLYYFFYNGFANDETWADFTETETGYLEMNGFGTGLDVQKFHVEEMNRVLRETIGFSITEFRKGIPESWVYYQPTDSYYTNHNDAVGVGNFTITRVIEDGDVVSVYYIPGTGSAIASEDGFIEAQEMLLTLHWDATYGYQVLANRVADPYAEYYELLKYTEERNWLNNALGLNLMNPETWTWRGSSTRELTVCVPGKIEVRPSGSF